MEKMDRRERERRVREKEIVDAAEELFYEKGYSSVSMDEIAQKADFTKRTLYKYFPGKDDLFYAVALQGFKKMASYMQSAMEEGKNGFEKMKSISYAYYHFYQDHPRSFYMMTQVGQLENKNNSVYTDFLQFDDRLFTTITHILEEGKKDGSIQRDIDAVWGSYAAAFSTTAFFSLFSITGKSFTTHFNLDQDQFVRYCLDFSLESIRAK